MLPQPRIALPDDPPREIADLLALTARAGGEPARTIAALAHDPPLVAPFLTWSAALALEGVLPHREHELLALRVAWRCRSAFEWGEHVEYARGAGVTDEEIRRIAGPPDAPGWSDRDRVLLRAADELHAECTVTDTTWTALAAAHDVAALVELTYVVGQYTMLSMVANALGLGAPEGAAPLPEP
jgi:alkylhydroperoxidase family enzyme